MSSDATRSSQSQRYGLLGNFLVSLLCSLLCSLSWSLLSTPMCIPLFTDTDYHAEQCELVEKDAPVLRGLSEGLLLI